MKLGLSSYSLLAALQSKEMDILQVIQWIKDHGGEHIEIVPLGFSLDDNPQLIQSIRQRAEDVGIEISNYAISANFIAATNEEYEQEIERVKKQVDITNLLGVKLMRHDVALRPIHEASIAQFEADLPKIVHACRQVADYAAMFGITTSIENHGYFIQASDRVQTVINHVNRANFKTTLDIGNFMCVDEDPVSAVKKNISIASMIHIKDFYHRPSYKNPGEGWFPTASGNYLRGAIVGHGDVDMREIVKTIKQSGYDGYISVEFEGLEECKQGSRIGMDNLRRLWEEL
ncbi:sugar phosphate isomerase/epimerase family protein [Peribacillus huizhouensis]|uniref:Sugar phosphate isomerase/epimerase n=1 Tax=Peribacillus huizhouensis TaxID=1501239 RepID=A0ABR6CNQ9_9BACI|nr:sugar phosphate isomerase/epimerase family protein [Peribacillus huizhouensis]MBA9026663.1 sugar phosphate isomerase/epimerase [Peribacillus huizhouensis]